MRNEKMCDNDPVTGRTPGVNRFSRMKEFLSKMTELYLEWASGSADGLLSLICE